MPPPVSQGCGCWGLTSMCGTTKTDDTDTKSDKDSGEHADADPKAKDHSANGKADDAADSTRHGDKTEADKPTSDKSHKEDDAAHHGGDEHPKDTDDKHTTKTDDADKSDKDDDKSDDDKSDDDDSPITTEEQYLAKQKQLEDYDHGIVPKEQRKEAYPENWDGDSSTIEGLRESVPARGYIEDLDGPDTNKIGTFDALPDGGSIAKNPQQILDGHPYSDWRHSDHYRLFAFEGVGVVGGVGRVVAG